ncbi:MAG: hypothetical protein NWQ19_05500, partial [Nonlabens sp.]|nr:hypothetical protein [Nonlabens sp.]
MNFNKLTIKSQEAVQHAQQLVHEHGQQQLEVAHILKGIITMDEHILPFLFSKVQANLSLIN